MNGMDPRFAREAYEFLCQALTVAQQLHPLSETTGSPTPKLSDHDPIDFHSGETATEREQEPATETAERKIHHVSGRELMEGVRRLGLDQFGMMAPVVFRTWGISSTLDFGRMVYSLIDAGIWQRSDNDRLEDFANLFDFDTAFIGEFRFERDEF
jgi:uncharacterized repeat protein (TIGR04138 family)